MRKGKSKDGTAGGYPKQPAYPTQAYPTQQAAPMQQPQMGAGYAPQPANAYPMVGQPQMSQIPPQGPPQGPPPPYQQNAPPAQGGYPQPVQGAYAQPQQIYPGQQPYQPMVIQYAPAPQTAGAYDSSARFGKGATHNIPPPPPGVMPTGVQVAAMQGQQVTMTQHQRGFFEGHSDGGATLW